MVAVEVLTDAVSTSEMTKAGAEVDVPPPEERKSVHAVEIADRMPQGVRPKLGAVVPHNDPQKQRQQEAKDDQRDCRRNKDLLHYYS